MAQSPVRLIGRSDFHRRVLAELACAAPTDVEILLVGPTGVGKEVYARWIHEHSARAAKKFVAVNCGALPTTLFENELFGHAGGAFTGAQAASEGLVADADGGTLFLDEIDALDIACQVKLLRFLQEREYRRLGETRMRRVNVRLITASNADLPQLVRESRFREDLMFRIHVFPVRIPPLRDRGDDIEPLIIAYVEQCADTLRMPRIRIGDDAMHCLESYSWPGNVRELENCIRYLTSLGLDRPIAPGDLKLFEDLSPARPSPLHREESPVGTSGKNGNGNGSASLRDAKRTLITNFERDFVIAALRKSHGNIAHAARSSGKTRRAFFELLRKYHVSASDYR